MSLKIIKAGIQDTVQDMGRYGYQSLGINPGGIMDKFSAQVANMLVGNEINKTVIELHFPASVFMFDQPVLIALSGADFSPSINGEKILSNHPVLVNKSSILQFHKVEKGARVYLAVHGGIDVPEWLGSRSTHLKAGFGGYYGRALQKEDEIRVTSSGLASSILKEKEFIVLPWQADDNWGDVTGEIFILPGNEWERLTSSSKENFVMTSFVITNQSDRMGYRLNNIPLSCMNNEELVSSAVSFGTVQLLPDGRLIVLMADHQTTGGYPRIAHVISAHHKKMAQMKAGDKIHFRFTDQQTAEQLMIKQQQHLQQLQNACKFRLQEFFNK
ncbi:MAG TPA: biotin-dependent carboxyltransferase family protein [Chitinophagaceae bacterium]|nr:biotin-dependent carboxyltransferase family protein [Chitinophagaceae bacterium]